MAKTFSEGFNYPFKNWKRLFNFWWALIPIFGWFAVVGYFREITESLLKKKDKELPEFKGFWRLFQKGFMFFLVMLVPILIVMIISGILDNVFQRVLLGEIVYVLIMIFVDFFLAMLFINYVKKDKYEAVFDVKKVWKIISKDWNTSFKAWGLQLLLMLVFGLLSLLILTIPVTFPAMIFSGYYFLVELYNKQA